MCDTNSCLCDILSHKACCVSRETTVYIVLKFESAVTRSSEYRTAKSLFVLLGLKKE